MGGSTAIAVVREAVPDRNLTPGVTRQVTISDVCSMPHEDVVREVPTSLRHEILQEYGIASADASDYEIDYLITPGLGGAEDIHNLWPESYAAPTWNARTKTLSRSGCIKWSAQVSSTSPQRNATLRLTGLPPTRSISIPTGLFPCPRKRSRDERQKRWWVCRGS